MFNGRKIIAVCLPKAYERISFRYISALNEYALEKGYTLFVYQTCTALYGNSRNDKGENYIFSLIDYDIIDGIIIFSELLKDKNIADKIAQEAAKHGIPAIAVERPVEGCINAHYDYGDCFEKIVRHIIVDHHLTKVNFIAGIKGNSFSEERLDIYKKVLAEQGIPYDPERVGYGDFWDYPTREVMKKFLADGKELPEAIICSNDVMAITACAMLADKGYSVPEDILISGFDGIEDEEYHNPRLTTCRSGCAEMCRSMIDTFEAVRNGGKIPDEILINFEMVKSQSCGCVKKKPNDSMLMIREMHDRLDGYQQRISDMNDLMSYISTVKKPELIHEGLKDKEMFNNSFCCLNIDALDSEMSADTECEPGEPFTDDMIMVYRGRFNDLYEPSSDTEIFKRKDIIPGFEKYIDMDRPVIFSSLHYLNIPLGYICLNVDINIVAYERIQQISETFGNGFGNVRMYNAMERLYIQDPMTGLYNRRGFYQLVIPEFEKAADEGRKMAAVVSADLDGLKYINDNFGHSEGDNAIKTVAAALVHAAVYGEICARFGGDEFVVAGVLSEETKGYSENFKKRFNDYIDNYNRESDKPYKVAASIGITCRVYDTSAVDELIKISDDLMYEDKAGRKQIRSRPRS